MIVRWTETAANDLWDIVDYIAVFDRAAADRLLLRIEEAVAPLGDHPNLGRVGRAEGTRELVVTGTQYIVAYRVKPSQVHVLRVLHGAREWPERL